VTPLVLVVVLASLGQSISCAIIFTLRWYPHSFETRDICDEVIRDYNNKAVSKPGGEEHLIQIRFSDTHEQKMLKQQTAAGRVFRAAEYEVGVAQARALGTPDRYHSISPVSQTGANEFEMFMQRGYRPPWAPAVPSTLGTTRPTVYHMAQAGAIRSEDGVSENGVEVKTNPATPVKVEDKSTGRDDWTDTLWSQECPCSAVRMDFVYALFFMIASQHPPVASSRNDFLAPTNSIPSSMLSRPRQCFPSLDSFAYLNVSGQHTMWATSTCAIIRGLFRY
jgi:hypothetical protein